MSFFRYDSWTVKRGRSAASLSTIGTIDLHIQPAGGSGLALAMGIIPHGDWDVFSRWGRMPAFVILEDDILQFLISTHSLESGDGETKVFSGTLYSLGQGIKTESITFTATVGTVEKTITDNGAGVLSGDSGNITGTIDYTTGAYDLTFTTAPDDDSVIYGAWQNLPELIVKSVLPCIDHHYEILASGVRNA